MADGKLRGGVAREGGRFVKAPKAGAGGAARGRAKTAGPGGPQAALANWRSAGRTPRRGPRALTVRLRRLDQPWPLSPRRASDAKSAGVLWLFPDM